MIRTNGLTSVISTPTLAKVKDFPNLVCVQTFLSGKSYIPLGSVIAERKHGKLSGDFVVESGQELEYKVLQMLGKNELLVREVNTNTLMRLVRFGFNESLNNFKRRK